MPIHGYPGGVISATPPTVDNTTASGIWTTEKQLQYQAQGLWPMPGPAQPISRSLRFNRADQAHLSRTPGSASNRKTWTWSGWVKRGQITASPSQNIFTAGPASTTGFQFLQSTDAIELYDYNGGYTFQMITTPVYRDVSAWYHIVVAFDTTQATQSNRLKLYVNGTQVTNFSTSSYPALNTDYQINNNVATYIGRYGGGAGYEIDGYMTEINFIDGQQLTPSSFGQTNSNTGVWEPKPYTGTYGTNGFYVNFSDNSGTTSTTLGKDYSGNGNNWTPNNFSVTAGAGNDSLVDTPTSYGTDTGVGGTVRGNYCTLNRIDVQSAVTLTNGNLDITGGDNIRGTVGCSTSGKWYFEYTKTNASSAGNYGHAGLFASTCAIGSLTDGTMLYRDDGNYYENNTLITTFSSYTTNDVVGVAVNVGAGNVSFYKNNVLQGTRSFVSQISSSQAVPGGRNNTGQTAVYNFGQRPFAYTAPSGFKSLCTQNLSTPTVAQGDDYFNTVLYTGNGSTQSITGVGFQPDFVWNKARSAAYSNRLADVLRGATNLLNTDSTGAAFTDANSITSFNTDGFSVGNSFDNTNAVTYVAWNWKANGAGVTNTVGSVTSTVSANTTAGFSIVTFTTPSSNGNYTTGHGLGVAPSMIITKSRSSTTQWPVWHIGLTGGASNKDYNIYLNLTNAQSSATDSWGSAAPNSTTFGVNVGTQWLGSINIVAYCFAAISAYSAFGSYTGNGSSDGPFIYTGFRPAFILFKQSSASGNDWYIYDSKRGSYNVVTQRLEPNASTAELTNYNTLDILSNGWKVRDSNSAWNASGSTYIYAAFAENPFKYALAR